MEKISTSRSSPWTDSRLLTKNPRSRSLAKNRSRSGRSCRARLTAMSIASAWASLKVTTPEAEGGPGVVVVNHPLGNRGGFLRVIPGASPPVSPVHPEQFHADVGPVAVPAGEGDQPSFVEGGVGERDERLVHGPVVPAQRQAPEGAGCLGVVEDRLELGGVVGVFGPFLFVISGGAGEEIARRQLLLVSGQDQGRAAVDAVDGIAGADLAGLVEDDHIEAQVRGQVLADRQRGHHEARLDRLRDVAGPFDQGPHRHVLFLFLRFPADDGGLAEVAAGTPRVAGADDAARGRCDEGAIEFLVFADQRVPVGRAYRGQVRVGPEVVLRPFLQQGPLDHAGHLPGWHALGNAEVDGDVEAVGGQRRPAGLVDVPFVLSAGVLAKSGDQVTRIVEVVEFGSQICLPAGVERLDQCFPGTLPRISRRGQLARRDRGCRLP